MSSDEVLARPWSTDQMVRVAQSFVALADTLVDDFDVVDLLDRLVVDCVDVLGVEAAGIVLVDPDGAPAPVANSRESSRLVELLGVENSEGPSIEALRTGGARAYPDRAVLAERWPEFAVAVAEAGFDSIYAIPLRLRSETIGALTLFGAGHPPLTTNELLLAQAMADVATIGILQQRSFAEVSLLSAQLQTALNSRITVEQAKGVVAEYGGIDVGDAFVAIRAYARSRSLALGEVASQLVTRELLPGVITGEGRRPVPGPAPKTAG